MQAPGWPSHQDISDISMDDIDDQLELIGLKRREIELRVRKKQILQSQADRVILQASPSAHLPFTGQPCTATTDLVEQEYLGIMNQDALSSSYPVGQGIPHPVVQPAMSSLDSDIACLPPSWLSLGSNDPSCFISSSQQNTMSTEPVLKQVVELSEKEFAESIFDQPLRLSSISQDKSIKPRLRQSSMTLVEKTRSKKTRLDIPGRLCFQLSGVTGSVRTKRAQSKEALERIKAIKKVGACLYCRYLKKPVCVFSSRVQPPLAFISR